MNKRCIVSIALLGGCLPGYVGATNDGGPTSSTSVDSSSSLASTSTSSTGVDSSSSLASTSTSSTSTNGGSSSSPSQTLDSGADSGLIAWYPMDTLSVAGVTPDATGNGHDATCTATLCPVLVPGHLGMAVSFDGSTQFLQVADSPVFHTTGPYTLAVWVNPGRVPEFFDNILGKPLGVASADSWALDIANPGVAEFFTNDDMSTMDHLASPGDLPIGAWSHVAAVWNGTDKRLFVNGTEVAASAWSSTQYDTHPVVIGADIDNGVVDGWLQGLLDDVRIYGRALSAKEIAALASQ
jgi:hypothetical protein